MDDNPPCQEFQPQNQFPFGPTAAQRLQDLKPGYRTAMLTTPDYKALSGWLSSFADVVEAADRLIAKFGRAGVCLQISEVLR